MEFEGFSKIARLSRAMVVTEKIDGTNAQIYVPEDATQPLLAGSRSRWLTPGKTSDNFGFAAWVIEHDAELRRLGPGRHYGEWFGAGIQRRYGLTEKRFALFNVGRWFDPKREAQTGERRECPPCCTVVPTLLKGNFDTGAIGTVVELLRSGGSAAVPGFMEPEGVVIFHEASKTLFKKTLVDDEKPKGDNNG